LKFIFLKSAAISPKRIANNQNMAASRHYKSFAKLKILLGTKGSIRFITAIPAPTFLQ
jgi:hypothetical protein